MNTDACEVCAILPTNEPIFMTDSWMVTLSPDQGYLGRCYVTLREHKSSLSELSDEDWVEFAEITRTLERATSEALGARLHNWGCLMNNTFQKDDPCPHVHWHMRPRYEQSVFFDDIEYIDPQFGYHYDRDQKRVVDTKTYGAIKRAIQDKL